MSKHVNNTVLRMNRQAYTVENVRKNADGSWDVLASVLLNTGGGTKGWYDVMYKNITIDSCGSVPARLVRHEDGWENPFKSYALMTKKGAKNLLAICEAFEQVKYWDEEVFCEMTKQSAEKLIEMKLQRDEYRANNYRWDLFE